MYDKAVVVSVKGESVTVLPLITGACMRCKEGCAKRGHPFTASNIHNLNLKAGLIVSITESRHAQAVQGLFSVILPIVCAIGAYIAVTKISRHLSITVSDAFLSLCVLTIFVLVSLSVCLVNRFKTHQAMPEINQIIE